MAYCEEEFECRRIMLLVHFGETFSAAQCKLTCDTCLHSQAQPHEMRDMTAAAQDALKARLLVDMNAKQLPAQADCCSQSAAEWHVACLCSGWLQPVVLEQQSTAARLCAGYVLMAALDGQVVTAVGEATLNHVVDVFKGASNAAVRNRGHDCLPEHGLGKQLTCASRLVLWSCQSDARGHVPSAIALPG